MSLLFERDKPWYADRQLTLEGRVRARLDELCRPVSATVSGSTANSAPPT